MWCVCLTVVSPKAIAASSSLPAASLPTEDEEPRPAWADELCEDHLTMNCGWDVTCWVCLAGIQTTMIESLQSRNFELERDNVNLRNAWEQNENELKEVRLDGMHAVDKARDVTAKLDRALAVIQEQSNNVLRALPFYYHPIFVASVSVVAVIAIASAVGAVVSAAVKAVSK